MKAETIPELIKFLSIQEQALGKQSPEVACTVSKLADLYMDKGLLDDAEKLYQRALEIRERAIGPHNREAEETRNSLARIKAIRKEDVVPPAPVYAGTSSSAGYSSLNQSQNQGHNMNFGTGTGTGTGNAAVDSSTSLDMVTDTPYTLNAQNLAEKVKEMELEVDLIRQVSGSESLQLADCLTKLADLYCRTKLYEAMEPLLIESLKIREAQLGTDHFLVANSLKNLARLYYFQSKFTVSKPLFEAAITIRKSLFGPRHPKVAEALTQYAKLLRKMKRIEEAQTIDQEVHSIRARHGTWHRL
ncbi:MAG: tetratricopeptide repeat protein [Candidatus Obscuribacterales bacterium]|nr:tetratricopeptide repeat protein [Cyanobacteria bacterium HKST-UBA01]MCB9471163.1 tetratricopeptide repeat protein [Candidatus Obscuribacterales bacterium]